VSFTNLKCKILGLFKTNREKLLRRVKNKKISENKVMITLCLHITIQAYSYLLDKLQNHLPTQQFIAKKNEKASIKIQFLLNLFLFHKIMSI
jgi:hypothetical protein